MYDCGRINLFIIIIIIIIIIINIYFPQLYTMTIASVKFDFYYRYIFGHLGS